MDSLPPQASTNSTSSPPTTLASPESPQKPARSRSRLLSVLLIVATITSVLSTLGFLGYLFLPAPPAPQPRSHFVALYAVGVLGVVVAEGCQILGVLALLVQWFSRANAVRKPKELLVLLVSLIPYMVVVIFLITLFVYLRARRQSPASLSTQEASRELKDQTVDTFVGVVSESSSSAVGAPSPSSAASSALSAQPTIRPTMRDALQRVVGPSTGRSLSEAAGGFTGVTMVALLLSTVATAAAAVPAHGLTPIQAYLPTSGSPGTTSTPSSLTGRWTLTLSNLSSSATCSPTPPQGCNSSIDTSSASTPVSIQENGNHIVMTFPGTPTATSTTSDPFNGGTFSLAGTISGNNVTFSYSFSGPVTSGGFTGNVNITEQYAGSILSANRMGGTFTGSLFESTEAFGQQATYTDHATGDWIATRG